MTLTLWGLKTCDTTRKALKALPGATLRDIRDEPLTADEIAALLAAHGEAAVNRASTTWRGLSDEDRARPTAELLAAHPTLMKRPVIRGAVLTIGWDKAAQAAQL